MGYEAASRSIMEHTTDLYVFETIETTDDIVARVQHITATHVKQVALVIISLYFETERKTSSGHLLYTNPEASIIYFLNSLRSLVRKTDAVFLLDHTCYFLLPGANLQGGQIVQSRLWDALLWRIHNTTDGEILRPCSISSGFSGHPTPSQNTGELIESAGEISLRSNFAPIRKTTTKQARAPHQNSTSGELSALARKLGIPYLSLLPPKPPAHIQQLVNPRLAQELHCYPLGRERNMLTVAMLNPQDHLALERLEQETGMNIFPVLTHPLELQTALEHLV